MRNVAPITGVTGQDGACLAEPLLAGGDGAPRPLPDVFRLATDGRNARTPLREGLAGTYDCCQHNAALARGMKLGAAA